MTNSNRNKISELLPGRLNRRVESMIIHDSVDEQSKVNPLCCSYRLFIAFLLGTCTFILYGQRQTLNLTIFCMINENERLASLTEFYENTTCRSFHLNSTSFQHLDLKPGPFSWNKDTKGVIIGSFYWGYCFQIFGGFLAVKIGSKLSLTLAVAISSAATIIIPFVADFGGNYHVIIALRVITGLFQGFVYPSALPMISKWSGKSEKSILISFLSAGSSLGIITSTVISGPICSTGYWEFNFIILGTMGFIWLLPWLKFSDNSPDKSSKIQNRELVYLKENSDKTKNIQGQSPFKWPLARIFSSKSVWVIIITNVLSDFTLYGILAVFPAYLAEVYGVNILLNSYISAGEYSFMWVSTIVFGILSGYIIRTKRLSVLTTRKICNSIGMVVPALIFPLIPFLNCDSFATVISLLVMAGGFPGAYLSSGFVLNAVDVAGPFSGIVFGLSNSLGSISGIIAPYAAYLITTESTIREWRICFIVFSIVLLIAGLVFALFSQGNLEPWAIEIEEEHGSAKKRQCNLVAANDKESDDENKLSNSIDEMLVPGDSTEDLAKNFDNVIVRISANSCEDYEKNFKNITIA